MVPLMTVARLSATGSRPGSGRNCPDCHDWIRSPCFSCGQRGSVLVGPATLACAADCRAFIRRGGSRRSPLPHVSVPSRTRDGHRWRLRQRLEQRKRAVNLSITHKFQTSKTQKNQSDINERIYLWRPTTPTHGESTMERVGLLPSGGVIVQRIGKIEPCVWVFLNSSQPKFKCQCLPLGKGLWVIVLQKSPIPAEPELIRSGNL